MAGVLDFLSSGKLSRPIKEKSDIRVKLVAEQFLKSIYRPHRRQNSLSNKNNMMMGVFMKDITAALLAIVFVLYSLIALLSVELNQDSTSSPLVSNQERISEVGLRVAFQR